MSRLVNDFGTIVRMPDRRYRQYLEAGASGEQAAASDYGECVGHLSFTATDAEQQDYQNTLALLPNHPLSIECPRCGANVGDTCMTLRQTKLRNRVGVKDALDIQKPHSERVTKAIIVARHRDDHRSEEQAVLWEAERVLIG